ncbi:MAG: DMT family transporter [Spirochaetia bacterium]|jgi:drug/metabolite transporter (DMT)-like permease|nr:DMT family transporter [Spirochaetia bacterium]
MYVLLGYLFALITAACWTQNSIIYTFVGKRIGSSTVTHIRLWIAFPAAVIINLIFTGSLLPLNFSTFSYIFIGSSGVFGFFIADLFIFKAFQHLGARKTMVIMTLSPIFSAVISWIVFTEVLSILQVSGVLITIAGVIVVIMVESRKTYEKSRPIWIIFAVTGALTQAIGMVLAKAGLSEGIHPISANVVRIGSGLGGLAVFTLLRGEFILDFKKMEDKRSFYLLIAAALVGPVFGMLLALYAFSWAPVGIVTTLMQLTPIMLLPIDKFYLKKHIPAEAVWGTMVAVAGAGILFISN